MQDGDRRKHGGSHLRIQGKEVLLLRHGLQNSLRQRTGEIPKRLEETGY